MPGVEHGTNRYYVFELYAADESCLYVGCTTNLQATFDSAREVVYWWPDVVYWWPDVKHASAVAYLDYQSASEAARERIAALNPRHNRPVTTTTGVEHHEQ